MQIQQVVFDIDTLHESLHAIPLAADMPQVALVATIDRLHILHNGAGAVSGQLAQPYSGGWHPVVGPAFGHGLAPDLQRQCGRIVFIFDIEAVKRPVGRDDREIRLVGEVPDGGFHAHDILGSGGFARDDVRRPQIDVLHLRREQNMRGLGIGHLDLAGCDDRTGQELGLRLYRPSAQHSPKQ